MLHINCTSQTTHTPTTNCCFGCYCKWMATNMRYWICYMCHRGYKWWPARHPSLKIVLLILHGSVTVVSCGTLILHWHSHPCSIDIIHINTNEAQPITTFTTNHMLFNGGTNSSNDPHILKVPGLIERGITTNPNPIPYFFSRVGLGKQQQSAECESCNFNSSENCWQSASSNLLAGNLPK